MVCEMKTEDLQFKGSDPGAVKYGNFINYYSFHSASQRTTNLHPQMFPASLCDPILCLDVGCNTGELTKELRNYLEAIYPNSSVHFLAVDIDPQLIQRAQDSNNDANICYKTLDIMNDANNETIQNYLKSYDRNKFDLVFCFSVTMWIHLNNGDNGLLNFLQYLKSISKTIIIEPQPWHCYRNAQRRVKKSGSTFPLYEIIKIRSTVDSVIEETLSKDTHEKIYESPSSAWKRKIQSYNLK